jgi:hypothetical protein
MDYPARFGWDVGVMRLRSSKPERAHAEQSERKGNRVRSQPGALGGSGEFAQPLHCANLLPGVWP